MSNWDRKLIPIKQRWISIIKIPLQIFVDVWKQTVKLSHDLTKLCGHCLATNKLALLLHDRLIPVRFVNVADGM